jgi:hypothetical protein
MVQGAEVTRLINADPLAECWSVSSHALMLLAFAATMTYCAQAQNIEGQPIAAQYGEFEVQNEGNGFAFDPANCNVTGGGENFPAFTTGTPVKVVDALPAQTEVSTAVTAFLSGSNCAVSLGGLAYQHTSFYLTSGTGGLQEALNNEKINAGGNNTIILNARWYELIAPRTASTVISTVSGSSSFGLVDITTNPYTSYNWNGSQYVQATPPGGSPSGAAGGALSGNYPNPGLSSNPVALPAGSTATTCTPGENDTEVATNACVAASASSGGPPSGTAGGSLSGTYPNPTIVGTTINPKVINGVSYSVNYPQATVAQRVNAACADAINRANGNTSGKCSSEGEAITQTDTSGTTITIGNSTGTEVTWIHPAVCEWTFSGYSGGTADIIDLYGGSSIEGETPVNNPCMIKYGGGTDSAYAVFQALVGSSGNTYFKVKGMGFYDSTASLQSGATMVVNATSDGSVFEDLLLTNYEPGQSSLLLNDAISYGQCCATTFNRIVANGNYNSGPIVKIIANGTNSQSSVEFTNSSFTHPGVGYPVISCNSSNTNGESLYFDNIYEEANHSDNTTALNQSTGCLAIKVNGMTVSDPGATSPYDGGPIWQLNGTLQTSFDLSGLTAVHGFSQPAIAVQNNISGFNCASTPCNVLTDGNGNLGHYTNATLRGDVISASVALQAPSVGTILQADGFPLTGGAYAGTYGAGTTYTQFQTVTYSGADWICLSSCTGVTPAAAAAGATQYWAQFDSTGAGLAATQADAAFYSAWGQVQAGASSFTAYSGVSLVFGNRLGGYNKNGDWVMPNNTFGYSISLYGQGRGATWIHQTASTLNYMVNSPNVNSSTGQTISGITLDANLLAGGCLTHHLRRSLVSDIACWNPQQQTSGTIASAMWLGQGADSYETLYQHLLVRSPTYPGLVAAYGTATVTSGAITGITWGSTGTDLNLPVTAGPGLVAYFIGKGPTSTSYQPCATMPVVSSIALTGGSINTASGVGGITFTSAGTSCGGTIYVRVLEAATMSEGYYLGGSDTTVDDIVTSGDFSVACEYINGPFSLKHEHPYCAAPYLIESAGGGVRVHTAPEMDSPIQYGMYIAGSGATVQGAFTEFNAGNEYGAGDFLIDTAATNFSINSSGCYYFSPQNFGGYAKFTGTTAGPLTQAGAALPASASITGVQENCDGSASLWGSHTDAPAQFSVKTYGALCNGSTDDSTALQSTINAAAVNGGNVVLPSATCNFATTLTRPRNVMVVGQGRNSSYLNYTGSTRAFVLGDTGANNPPSWKGGFQHLTLEGPSGSGSTVGLYMGADPAGIISPTGTLDDDEEWIDLAVLKFGIGATVNNNTYLLSAIDTLFGNNGQHWKDISTNSNAGERMSFVSSIFGQSQSSTAPAIELDNNLGDYYFTNGSMDYNNTSQPDIACLAGNMHVTLTDMHMEKLHGEKIHVNNTVCSAEIHIFGGTYDTTGTGTTDPDMIGLSGIFTSQNVVSVVGAAVEANEPLTQFIDANNPSRQITVDSLAWENFGNLGACVNNEGNPAGIVVRNTAGCTSADPVYAPLASPALSGTPTAPTATAGTNTTQLATTQFVTTAVAGAGGMVYPGAGVANSTGSAWGTSYTVGTGANNLLQLNASSQIPAVNASLLTSLNASNLASGTVPAAQMPALTGDCTTTAGAVATTCTKTNGTAFGTAATQNTGTSGANVPLLNGANTHSGASTFSAAGAASTPGETVSGAPYTGGTATTNFPQFYLNQGTAVTSFSTAGEEFGINAPSGYTGNLINAFVNGSSTKFRVDYAGDVFNAGYHTTAANGTASQAAFTLSGAPYTGGTATTDYPLFYLNNGTAPTTWNTSGTLLGINGGSGFGGNMVDIHQNGGSSLFSISSGGAVNIPLGNLNTTAIELYNTGFFGFSSTTSDVGTRDTLLCRGGAAGIVSVESGVTSCTNTVAGGNGTIALAAVLPGVLYSAAGTALPTCASGIKGQLAVVSDATSPTYMGAYASGGGITAAVICSYNGTTYSWLTH